MQCRANKMRIQFMNVSFMNLWRFIAFAATFIIVNNSLQLVDAQSTNVELIIFRDYDSLTIFIPANNNGVVSLQGLRLEIVDNNGDTISQGLDAFPAFRALFPFNRIPTPACLRLERDSSQQILPLECENTFLIIQELVDGNIFWADSATRQERIVRVVRIEEAVSFCSPEQVICEVSFTPVLEDIAAELPTGGSFDLIGLENNPVPTNESWRPYTQTFGDSDMLLVPVGCFMMGSSEGRDNELPIHQQCIESPFWIDTTEVTNAQFGSYGYWAEGGRPRETVNWFEAQSHCAARGARLPTEVEWEYAARGPNGLSFSWGNEFDASLITYGANSNLQTEFVATFDKNASWVGALDMNGNVWEWVSSADMPYPYDPSDGRENTNNLDVYRIRRGGSWMNAEQAQTTTFRVGDAPTNRLNVGGFRCVRDFQIEGLDLVVFANRMTAISTPTPIPLPMVNVLSGSNLRSGPGSQYDAVGSARQGQNLLLLGQLQTSDGVWYQVRDLDGRVLWIRADLVELLNVVPQDIPQSDFTN